MAPKPKPITKKMLDTIYELAGYQCTETEIISMLKREYGVGRDWFYARKKGHPEFAAALEEGRDKGKMSLRRARYRMATGWPAEYDEENNLIRPYEKPVVSMSIWLGKQHMGERDVAPRQNGDNGHPKEKSDPLGFDTMSGDELIALVKKLKAERDRK